MKHKYLINAFLLVSAFVGFIVGVYTIATNIVLGVATLISAVVLSAVYVFMKKHSPYEIEELKSEIVIDIQDKAGEVVFYSKRSQIRSLRHNLSHHVEELFSDGTVNGFDVEPGTIESIKTEASRILVTTTFGHPLRKWEEIERTFKATFHNALYNARESYILVVSYPKKDATIIIIFPKERPYKDYRAIHEVGLYNKQCTQPIERIIKGRPALIWDVQKLDLKDRYKLEWSW